MLDLNAPITIDLPTKRTIDAKWSSYQADIFEFVDLENGNAVVEAVAGSGKTTTIRESMKYINGFSTVTFLAFNRAIADELRTRVPEGVDASTFHALGNKALRSHKPLKLNKRRVQAYIDKKFDDKYKSQFYPARQLIDLARNVGLGLPEMPDFSIENLNWLADDYDLLPFDSGQASIMVGIARSTLLAITRDDITDYDFTDMLYLPLLWNAPFPNFNITYVDEAQDLNMIQHMMLKKICLSTDRLLAVGDTHQAIYGFRGAEAGSMQALREHFNARSFPLSISYRCSRAVVEQAQSLVPHIRATDHAIDGSVSYSSTFPALDTLTNQDMVLCRNNAPLIGFALRMLSRRLPMRFQGNFGDSLLTFINSFKTSNISMFQSRMEAWYENEVERLTSQERWGKLALVRDKYEAIQMLIPHAKSVPDLSDLLARLFEQGDGPIISSIHKAKGMEANRVFFYKPELLPSRYARSLEALQQENNLKYVAITRARNDLIYVSETYDNEEA